MVRVKICGVTTVEDALLAAQLGADAIGLNFFPGSARHISEDAARSILSALPAFVEPVGLFVNEPEERVRQSAANLNLRTVQWHGDRPAVFPSLRTIPAFAVRDRDSLRAIESFVQDCRTQGTLPSAVLLDAHVPGLHGGTGQVAPWDILAGFDPGVPLILAGGLTPDNVAEAIRRVRPYAVDVASGVESAPGRKDREKMKRFFEAVRVGGTSGTP